MADSDIYSPPPFIQNSWDAHLGLQAFTFYLHLFLIKKSGVRNAKDNVHYITVNVN